MSWQWQQKGGWGKGWGKGGYQGYQGYEGSRSAPTLPADFEIEAETRYTGTVITFHKWQGYGFIKPDQDGVVPNDKLYVHWSNIQTDDRYPFLVEDQNVEFGMMKWKDWKANGETLRAKAVTAVGGGLVAVQDEADAKKTFVGGQKIRYTGTLKFFNPQQGYGYVTMDDGYALPEAVPKELRVDSSELSSGGKPPRKQLQNLAVEFGVVKTKDGKCMAYNMTLPGGAAIMEENLENRQVIAGDLVQGTITVWNRTQGWGFIQPDASVELPPSVTAKIEQQQEATKAKGKTISSENGLYFRRSDVAKGFFPKKEGVVKFKLYTDDAGAGACDVQACDVQE